MVDTPATTRGLQAELSQDVLKETDQLVEQVADDTAEAAGTVQQVGYVRTAG